MKPENSALSDLATDLRNRAGLSYDALALQTGYTRWTLARYGNGETKIPIGYVAFLARALAQGHLGGERASAAVAKGLLKELNLAIEPYYGKAEQLHSWEHLLKVADAWVEAKQKTPSAKDVSLAMPWHLRAALPDFIGRTDELAQLVRALSNTGADPHWVGLVCIRGLGGMGKTELAYRAASELTAAFPDGQLLLSLGGSNNTPATAEQLLQQALRAFTPQAPLPETRAELRAQYLTATRGRRVLIVADDARDAAQLRDLAPPPGSALLITTRWRFPVDGLVDANTIELAGLDTEGAVRLLHTLCPRLGEDAFDLAALCGHMPLALRIAGGRLASDATLRVGSYLERLRDAQKRLAALHEDPNGERSVAAVLEISYAALDPQAQTVLAQLSAFPASFTRAAVPLVVKLAGLVEDPDLALDRALSVLHRACLIEYEVAGDRIQLHDLVRAFAADKLGDDAAAHMRHATAYARLIRNVNDVLPDPDAAFLRTLTLFDAERPHIEAGLQWAIQHAGSLEADNALCAFFVGIASVAQLRMHTKSELIPFGEAALEAAQRRQDIIGAIDILQCLGAWHNWLGDLRQGQACYQQAQAYDQQVFGSQTNLVALLNRASGALSSNDIPGGLEAAKALYQAAVERENLYFQAYGLFLLGFAENLGGTPAVALQHTEAALTLVHRRRNTPLEMEILISLANIVNALPAAELEREELYERACMYANQAILLADKVHGQMSRASALNTIGNAANVRGKPHDGIEPYQQALALYQAAGNRYAAVLVLGGLGDVHKALGDHTKAISFYEQAIVESDALGDRSTAIKARWECSKLLVQQGEIQRAQKMTEQIKRLQAGL